MTISDSDVRAGEMIFETTVGDYDSKHINNLADVEVSEDILRQIEAGCPIETIDELGKKYPICKYRTQITIHGKFPELATRRAGGFYGYVNLCRNQNGSIGVRWDAIDNAKKKQLFSAVRKCRGWGIVHNSTTYCMRHYEFLTAANKDEVINRLKGEVSRIENGKHLFFGGAKLLICSVPFLGPVAVLQVSVNAYYESNYQAILECITGMTADAIADKIAAYDEEQKRKAEEMERKHAEYKAEQEKAEAEVKAHNEKWLADNPSPFPKCEGHTLVAGDIIAKPAYPDGYGKPKKFDHWAYFIIGKAFGRLTMTPCDADGKKERFVRGREVRNATGDFYLKAAKAAVPFKSVRPSPSSKGATATACTVRENYAKHGIEVKFNAKPSAAVIASLKANGFRWSGYNGVWYTKKSEKAVEFANSLAGRLVA